MIATYALRKVPGDAIDSCSSSISSSIVALLAIVSVVHGVILGPVIVFIPCWRSCVVVLVLGVSDLSIDLCVGTTYHIGKHNGQCEQSEPIFRNHFVF